MSETFMEHVIVEAENHAGTWISWDGALPPGFVIPLLPPPVVWTWPVAIQQFADEKCSFAACFNAGIDVSEAEFPNPFMSLKDMVNAVGSRPGSPWQFFKCAAPALQGVFVMSAHNHCFSVINGWYLDSDPRFPHPVRGANTEFLGIAEWTSVTG